MGRINLGALRVRKRALASLKAKQTQNRPVWLDILADIPPAQILTRQQPLQHPAPRIQSQRLPGGRTELILREEPRTGAHLSNKKQMYKPTELRFDEDALRKQFFSDHPWELARPRVVLETRGSKDTRVDWSTGLIQPGIPLSGESVVQRQLWLLQNVPEITIEESYGIARKEFYNSRRREATSRRIAVEEAKMMGADFGPSDMAKAMTVEGKVYDDWEQWAASMNLEFDAKNAAFSGQQMPGENRSMEETRRVEGSRTLGSSGGPAGSRQSYMPERPGSTVNSRIGQAIGSGSDLFKREARKRELWGQA